MRVIGLAAAVAISLTACGGGTSSIAAPSPSAPAPLPEVSSTPIEQEAVSPPAAPVVIPPPVPAPSAPSTAPVTTTPPSVAPAPLAGRVVVIDPGHDGGNAAHARDIATQVDIGTGTKECDTVGAQTADGYPEHALNFDVAQRLRDRLTSAGVRVALTHTDDTGWGPCITRRAAIGNEAHAAAAISVHADGGPSNGRGFHVILPAPVAGLNDAIVAPSRRLGQAVHSAFAAATGEPTADYLGSDGYTVRSDLGGLNLSTVPKVFIEMGNMDNGTDAARLETPAYRDRMAAGVAAGITAFLKES